MIQDELDKKLIWRIIEIDKTDKPVLFTDIVTEIILGDGIYIDLGNPLISQIFIENELNEKIIHGSGFYILRKQLLQAVTLIDYLVEGNYILLIKGHESKIVGKKFDTGKFVFANGSLLYPELESKVKNIASKYIVPLKLLVEYANNNFRSIERVAIDEQFKNFKTTFEQQEKSIKWTKVAVWIAAIGLAATVLLNIWTLLKPNEIQFKNDKIVVDISNDSLNVTIKTSFPKDSLKRIDKKPIVK